MNFPYLPFWDNATCKVECTETTPNENGEFPTVTTYEGGCNYSEKTRSIRGADGGYVRLSCVIHIQGDIAPNLPAFSGRATVNGRKMLIETVDRPRNPDGTIHHTRLGLI